KIARLFRAGYRCKKRTSPVGTTEISKRMMQDDKNPSGLIQNGLVQIKKKEDACPGKKAKLDLNAVRERIDFAVADDAARKTGPEYWRSLEELAGTEDFQEALHREFPKG